MTPKEKAKELVEKFYAAQQPYNFEVSTAKKCALIAVDEMQGMLPAPNDEWHEERMSFLEEVKTEINNL